MDAVVDCHLPVLDAHQIVVPRSEPAEASHVADRRDARCGEQPLIGHDAIVKLKARAFQPPGGRDHADAHHDQVGRNGVLTLDDH